MPNIKFKKKMKKLNITSSTAFSLALSDNLNALISAFASPNSLSLTAKVYNTFNVFTVEQEKTTEK